MIFKVFLLLALYSLASPARADIALSFGVYTSDKPTTMVKKFRPVLNALERELEKQINEKVKIKLHISRSYEDGIADIVEGKVDISRLGPASYVNAKQLSPGLRLLVMESKKNKKRFNGVIGVRSDSGINSISDLKGKRFAFGNQRSTIGRYLSQAYLVKQGLYAKDLSQFEYHQRHDKVGYVVANGQYDAGALKESTFRKLVKKGQPLKALAYFENVTKPWVAHSDMSDFLFFKIQQALINIKDKSVLRSIKKDGFIEAADSEYDFIRDAITNNNKFFK